MASPRGIREAHSPQAKSCFVTFTHHLRALLVPTAVYFPINSENSPQIAKKNPLRGILGSPSATGLPARASGPIHRIRQLRRESDRKLPDPWALVQTGVCTYSDFLQSVLFHPGIRKFQTWHRHPEASSARGGPKKAPCGRTFLGIMTWHWKYLK